MNRPDPGEEARFRALMAELVRHKGILPDPSAPPRKLSEAEVAARRGETEAISLPAYAHLGAPVVGRDPTADAWLRAAIAEGRVNAPGIPPDEVLARMAG